MPQERLSMRKASEVLRLKGVQTIQAGDCPKLSAFP